MTTTQAKSNHYDPVALEAALRKFEQEQFDASKEVMLKNFIRNMWDCEFNAEEGDTTKLLLKQISNLIDYSQEESVPLPEEVTSKLTEILSTVSHSEDDLDDDKEDWEDEEDYFTNESEDDFIKEEDHNDDGFYDADDDFDDDAADDDRDFDDEEDDRDLDDDDADEDDDDLPFEPYATAFVNENDAEDDDEKIEEAVKKALKKKLKEFEDEELDDEDDDWPFEFSDFDEFVDKYDLAPNVKRWGFDPKEPRTEGWLVFPEFVPPKPTLKPVLFEIPFTFEDYFAIGEALEANEELSELQQKQYQQYKSLTMCPDLQFMLEGYEQSFSQADFTHYSHPYLILFGQLYRRPFLNLSQDQQVTKFYKQVNELLYDGTDKFVKESLKDLVEEMESNWEVVTDKSLLQAFAHKPDGRYPLEFVRPVNLNALGNVKEKLKYFKQLVVNFNVEEFRTLDYYKYTYCDSHDIDDAKSTGFLRRFAAYEHFIYAGISSFLYQFDYFHETEYRLLDLDGAKPLLFDFSKVRALGFEIKSLVPLEREETFFAEWEYPWLVFNGHVFRPRLNKDETSPTKPIELEVGPEFSSIVFECSPDGVEEKLVFDFIRDDQYLSVELLTHWGTSQLQGQDDAVINWLLKNGWVEVIDSKQIPQTSYFSHHLREVSYVTRNYTQDDLELFKLFPNGFYKRPPFYNEAWLTSFSPEEVEDPEESIQKYLPDEIAVRNKFRDYKGEPVGFDNDFYYRSDEPVLFAGLSKQEVLNHLTCQLIDDNYATCAYRHFEFSSNSHPFVVVNGRLYCRSLDSDTDVFIRNFDFASLPAEVEGVKRPNERLSDSDRYNLQCRPGVDFSEEFAFAGWKQVLDYRLLDHFSGVPDGRYPVPEFWKSFDDHAKKQLYFHSHQIDLFFCSHHLETLQKLMPRFKNNHYCLLSAQADSGVALTPQQETILSVQKRLSDISHCLLSGMKGLDEYVLFFDKSDAQRKQLEYFACPNLEELIISTNSKAKSSNKDQSSVKQDQVENASATTQSNATAITQADVTTSTTTGTGKSLASVGFSEPTFEHNRLPLLVLGGKVYRVRTEGETTPYCELRRSQTTSGMRELPDGRYSLPPGYRLGEKIPEINIKLVEVIKTLHQLINASRTVELTTELSELLDSVKKLLDEDKLKD